MPFTAGHSVRPPNKGRSYPQEPCTSDEVRSLIRAAQEQRINSERNVAMLAVLWRGGMRIAEVTGARLIDLDMPGRTLRTMTPKGHGSGKPPRTIGLDALALEHLDPWVEQRIKMGERGGPLFVTCPRRADAGGPLRPIARQNFSAWLRKLADECGIVRRVTPHSLRHTLAMELTMEGMPIPVISGVLGHERLETTVHYLHRLAPAASIKALQERTTTP